MRDQYQPLFHNAPSYPDPHAGSIANGPNINRPNAQSLTTASNRTGQATPPSDSWTELDDLRDFVENGWVQYSGLDGPTFLWNRLIPQVSKQDDSARVDAPVATLEQARTIMMTPIEWYLHGVGETTSSATPTAGGYDIPREDMPTFRKDSQALAGVKAVIGNAMMSSRWVEATRNLVLAARISAMFMSNIADRDDDGLRFLNGIIENIRIYFDALARYADPASSELALQLITDAACSESFKAWPKQRVELLSCCISFARWDDTRALAYDALSRATRAMRADGSQKDGDGVERGANRLLGAADGNTSPEVKNDADVAEGFEYEIDTDDGDGEGDEAQQDSDRNSAMDFDKAAEQADCDPLEQIERTLLYLHHDLLRMSGDNDAADMFLFEHRFDGPMADAYAARLIAKNRWRELLELSVMVMNDNPNQQLSMIPAQMVPYEWDSIRELALQELGRRRELRVLYRTRIIDAFSRDEVTNVQRLRAVSGKGWPEQVRLIVREYDDGRGRFVRNPAYEYLLVSERMGIEAWRYCQQFPKARSKLSRTIALVNPEHARKIVLGKINPDGTYCGELPARTVVYRGIAQTLQQYASVFGRAQAEQIARALVTHYPTRHTLASELEEFLDLE